MAEFEETQKARVLPESQGEKLFYVASLWAGAFT